MNFKKAFAKAALGIAAAGAIMSTTSGCAYYDESTVRAVVNDKAIETSGDKDSGITSTYMIFTSAGVYTDSDSLVKRKYNSSDVYNALQKGCSYDFTVYGRRSQMMSTYKNIDTVKFVPTAACPTAPVIG